MPLWVHAHRLHVAVAVHDDIHRPLNWFYFLAENVQDLFGDDQVEDEVFLEQLIDEEIWGESQSEDDSILLAMALEEEELL